jgi:hypothetical protein
MKSPGVLMAVHDRYAAEVLHCVFLWQTGRLTEMTVEEKVAAVITLNQPETLSEFGYTLPQALDKIRLDWLRAIPLAGHVIAVEAAGLET